MSVKNIITQDNFNTSEKLLMDSLCGATADFVPSGSQSGLSGYSRFSSKNRIPTVPAGSPGSDLEY